MDSLSRFNEVYIVAQAQQQLVYRAKANLSGALQITGIFPVDRLPAGIVQITVFDKYQQPVAERLIFVNQQDYFFITDLNPASIDLRKRKKNVIQVDVPDSLSCNLSLSVTDADLNPISEGGSDIFSTLLLTSDIKGYVHNPRYYFSSDADSIARHLDLVMLTNGWRRFKWEEAINFHFPTIRYKPENFLTIEGKVYGIPKGSLINRELNGILEVKNKNKQIVTAPVAPDGTFSIPGLIFYDTAHLYYQFNNDKDKRLTSRASIELSNNLVSKRIMLSSGPGKTTTASEDSLLIQKNQQASDRFNADREFEQKIKVLATVDIKAKQKTKKQLMDEEYSSGFFRGGDDVTFIVEDDPSAVASFSVLNYLQSRVAGLDIKLGSGQPTLNWRGGIPTIFLNEVQNDVQSIQDIPMSDVAMIKVFRPPFFGAIGGGTGGAIAVYLKKGAQRNGNIKGLEFSGIEGYTNLKEFYSPDYSKADQSISQEDIRTTLYWNPFVVTDKEHRKVLLHFYNNDISKKIKVTIEGVNQQGKLTRIEKVFQ